MSSASVTAAPLAIGLTVIVAPSPSVRAMTLPQEVLGRTDLSVTKLGYGAMEVRGSRIWGGRPIEDADAETILNAVVDSGDYLHRHSQRLRAQRGIHRPVPVAPA